MERTGVTAFQGKPLTLIGGEVKVGDKAPDIKAISNDMTETTLSDLKGKIKVIAAVPSLDTPVCDLQIKRFNDEVTNLSKDVTVVFISMDLPFAQKRFCQTFNIKKVKTLSDHRGADFGVKFGVLIKELRLLARAVFVLDKEDRVVYAEYVKDLTLQPDYAAVIEAVKKLV